MYNLMLIVNDKNELSIHYSSKRMTNKMLTEKYKHIIIKKTRHYHSVAF